MVDRFPETRLVVKTGELVVVGALLEQDLVLLAPGDQAQHAVQANRLPRFGELRRCAFMDPAEAALLGANAVLAIERFAGGEVFGQVFEPGFQIVRIDALMIRIAGQHRVGRTNPENVGGVADPRDVVPDQIPGIDHVAGTGERSLHDFRLISHCVFGTRTLPHAHPTKCQHAFSIVLADFSYKF